MGKYRLVGTCELLKICKSPISGHTLDVFQNISKDKGSVDTVMIRLTPLLGELVYPGIVPSDG